MMQQRKIQWRKMQRRRRKMQRTEDTMHRKYKEVQSAIFSHASSATLHLRQSVIKSVAGP